jgi:intracellular sulfur oxidation DsrE/DsrF family protein
MDYIKEWNDSNFRPAAAALQQYHVLYVINESGSKIKSIIGNITNVLKDPRLEGKLFIELLAFGDGIEMLLKANNYEELLKPLIDKGVVLVQCINTLTGRGISREELYPFVHYVPSANGEMILRQYEGWAIVKP